MTNKILKIISGIAAGITIMSAGLPVRVNAATVGELNGLIDGIVVHCACEKGCTASGDDHAEEIASEWVEKLKESAGDGSEWFVLALRANGNRADYMSYSESLAKNAKAKGFIGATERQRMALAMIACGDKENAFVKATADETPEQLGIMSRVFGLHLLNNGIVSSNYDAGDLISQILSMRKEDGGWAVMGAYSDTDVTAMAVQALAPYITENEEVASAVDNALRLLSEKQCSDGDFSGFGYDNPESTAQVIMALTAVGTDPLTDERFIKNGNTVLSGLLKYKKTDGSFSHVYGGEENTSATYQAMLALVSLKRFYEGRSAVYIFDDGVLTDDKTDDVNGQAEEPGKEQGQEQVAEPAADPTVTPGTEVITQDPITSEPTRKAAEETEASHEDTVRPGKNGLKTGILCGILFLGAVACLVLFLRGRRNPVNYVFVGLVCALLCVFAYFTEFSSGKDYYSGKASYKENAVGKVTITIRCDTISDAAGGHIPRDGVILPVTEYLIEEGDTVYDILIEAAKEHGVSVENHGSASGAHGMVYIAGINYIYEQQFGELSGWIYHVNGVSPSYGCGDYVLSDGDVIEWLYTRDLGRDLGENFDTW